ncbi:serine/threonine-protein kinase [Paludisphaera mucosa]|uniref:Serine/threonine-protein kinase n=1 Tax=Paludisphaera mucosa TaxID=3030827 RepID=A0ABT6FI33_9BACT|nr:serine/threonine-protein kinase [Paludisphaera mucosa]MDG3007237.1 serine/threonine-protein kinase [Paludisphaera mucosa]
MHDPEFESRVLRFERAWRSGGPPEIGDYLGHPFATTSPGREKLLVELICVDLEFRARSPAHTGPPTLASYVDRFPELHCLDRLPVELVGEAYRVRRRWGDRPSHATFLEPFKERRDEIHAALLHIDAELHDELGGVGPPARPSSPSHASGIVDEGADVPMLSHRDFLLRRLIGAGRTGKVYEAGRLGDGRDVAVKFLRKSLLRHADVVRRFVDEARIVAGLHHPNIVGVQGLGRTPAGSYFIVMELVLGGDLSRHSRERRIPEDEAVRWAMEICEALAHAHERGVVHCDLKPANILIDVGGRIRVTDFGLARSLAGESLGAAEVEGTAPFMAPEQASRSWGVIDRRTDVYGLGAVLYALLTGRPPFVGERSSAILADVVSPTPVVSPSRHRPDLSERLSDLCRRCLAKSPEDRFATADEVRSALVAFQAASPRESTPGDAQGFDRPGMPTTG